MMSYELRARRAGAGAAVLLGVLLLGCEGNSFTPPPPPEVTISVLPREATIDVGGSVQLSAVVNGTDDKRVVYASAAPSVASVDGAGLVRGLGAGVAVITATPAVGGATATSTITVNAAPRPTVVISSVRRNGGSQVLDPSALSGRVDVLVSYDALPGVVRRLDVFVDEQSVCPTSLGGAAAADRPAAPQTVVCTFDTAAFDASTGTPRFRNGAHGLSARLFGAAGEELARASLQAGFANRDTVIASHATGATATDSVGLAWTDGGVTLRALPVIYGPGAVGQAVFRFSARVDTTLTTLASTDATPGDGLAVTFPATAAPAAGGTAGMQDTAAVGSVQIFMAAGSVGPAASTAGFRYDNAPPTLPPNTFTLLAGFTQVQISPGFEWKISTTGLSGWLRDGGIGSVTCAFHAGGANDDPSTFKQVTRGSDLPTTTNSGAYTAQARCRDKLGNEVTQMLTNGSGTKQTFSVQ